MLYFVLTMVAVYLLVAVVDYQVVLAVSAPRRVPPSTRTRPLSKLPPRLSLRWSVTICRRGVRFRAVTF